MPEPCGTHVDYVNGWAKDQRNECMDAVSETMAPLHVHGMVGSAYSSSITGVMLV